VDKHAVVSHRYRAEGSGEYAHYPVTGSKVCHVRCGLDDHTGSFDPQEPDLVRPQAGSVLKLSEVQGVENVTEVDTGCSYRHPYLSGRERTASVRAGHQLKVFEGALMGRVQTPGDAGRGYKSGFGGSGGGESRGGGRAGAYHELRFSGVSDQ
jgi:hypothetical protein